MIRLVFVLILLPAFCFPESLTEGETEFLRLIGSQAETGGVEVVPLWPGEGAPPDTVRPLNKPESVELSKLGNPSVRNVTAPSLVIVPPGRNAKPAGITMVFAPGGGYGALGLTVGRDLRMWADAVGAEFALLKYRVPRAPKDPGRKMQLSDAQRALRILRGRSDNKIVMLGASAGGHLAFHVANNHAENIYQPRDETDRRSARPDAAVLLYPAYLTNPIESMESDPYLHLDLLSPDRTPPILMTVTRPDKFTHGAVNAMLKLRAAKVPAELHIYPEGGHAGCFNKYPLMEFVRPAARFLKDQGIFTPEMETISNNWLDKLESAFLSRPLDQHVEKISTKEISGVLPETEWSAGDRALAELHKGKNRIIPLWPGDGTRENDPLQGAQEEVPDSADGRVRIAKVTRPTLHIWSPEKPDGRAVIVFPGGGYHKLAAEHEGTEIARWLNDQGITAFVCKYRVPRREGMEKHTAALEDARQAIQIIRTRADEFGIKSGRIGVIGFSAGGNLAALTVHQAPNRKLKPDYVLLIYPAYLNFEREGAELDPALSAFAGPGRLFPRIYRGRKKRRTRGRLTALFPAPAATANRNRTACLQ